MSQPKMIVGTLVTLLNPGPFVLGGEDADWAGLRERHGIGLVIAIDNEEGMVTVLWSGPAPSSVLEDEFVDTLRVMT